MRNNIKIVYYNTNRVHLTTDDSIGLRDNEWARVRTHTHNKKSGGSADDIEFNENVCHLFSFFIAFLSHADTILFMQSVDRGAIMWLGESLQSLSDFDMAFYAQCIHDKCDRRAISAVLFISLNPNISIHLD